MSKPEKTHKSVKSVRVAIAAVIFVFGLITMFALNPAITAPWLNLGQAGFILTFCSGLWLFLEMLTAIPALDPISYQQLPYRPNRRPEALYRSITGTPEEVEKFMAETNDTPGLWTSSRPVHLKDRQRSGEHDGGQGEGKVA